jgi:LAS superfamily LD-carboxypeptidase LdcB
MDFNKLTGRESNHLKEYTEGEYTFLIDTDTLGAYLNLKEDLASNNINLNLTSAFRSFERQLDIWNLKASGKRTLLNRDEQIVEFDHLSPLELVHTIMTWSALPGASRHHWGTDIDVFDANVKDKEDVQLTIQECEQDFSLLYQHLDQKLLEHGFFRPYAKDLGGVSREPWHLSYKQKSQSYLNDFSFKVFRESIENSQDMLLRDVILDQAKSIYDQYIINISAD